MEQKDSNIFFRNETVKLLLPLSQMAVKITPPEQN
jgi:hypothetical protein